jgi:hypothetical protein
VALHPGFVLKRNEGGMSNYGVHVKTVAFYTLALLCLALYSRRAAWLYKKDGDRRTKGLRSLLMAYSAVVFFVLLSTYGYTVNSVLKDVHFALGTALIVVVGVGSLWMYRQWPSTVGVGLLLFIQIVGDVLSLLTVIGMLHLLFVSEIVANVGFASILIRSCRRTALDEPKELPLRDPSL